MSFRGFDIGAGINRYADLMAQGQKDQIELQKMYAAQAQAQADKEFNRQQTEMRNQYMYGVDPQTGLSPAEKARKERAEISAGASIQNTGTRTQSAEEIAAANRALLATKMLGGKTPEMIALENQSAEDLKLYDAKRRMYQDILIPRKDKPALLQEMKDIENRINTNREAIKALSNKGPSKAQPMYQQPQAPKAPVSDDDIWAAYLEKHPGVPNTPANRQKLFQILNKGK